MSENQLFHSQISLNYNQFPQNSNYLGSFSNAVLYLKGIIANGHTNHIMPSICLLWQYTPIASHISFFFLMFFFFASHISNPMFVCQSFRNQWVLGMFLCLTNTQHHQYKVTDRKLDLLNASAPWVLQNKTYASLMSANYQLPKLPQTHFQVQTSSSTLQVKSTCYFSRCTTVGLPPAYQSFSDS